MEEKCCKCLLGWPTLVGSKEWQSDTSKTEILTECTQKMGNLWERSEHNGNGSLKCYSLLFVNSSHLHVKKKKKQPNFILSRSTTGKGSQHVTLGSLTTSLCLQSFVPLLVCSNNNIMKVNLLKPTKTKKLCNDCSNCNFATFTLPSKLLLCGHPL